MMFGDRTAWFKTSKVVLCNEGLWPPVRPGCNTIERFNRMLEGKGVTSREALWDAITSLALIQKQFVDCAVAYSGALLQQALRTEHPQNTECTRGHAPQGLFSSVPSFITWHPIISEGSP